MSYFLRVICRRDDRLLPEEVQEFIEEGVYFEATPEFTLVPDGDGREGGWSELRVRYDKALHPVVIHNTARPEFEGELEELAEIVKSVDSSVRDRIAEHLGKACQVIAFEINPATVTEDAWVMIDCVGAFLAKKLDGIIYAPGEGFYDASLQQFGESE